MQRYWDLSEKERAELSDADMSAYEKIELMERGLVVPPEPEYEDVVEVVIPTYKVYKLTYNSRYNGLPILFKELETAEEAAAALRGGMTHEADYNTGKSFVKAIEEISITTETVCEESDINKSRSALAEAKAAKSRNDIKRREYQDAVSKLSEALTEMRNDRYECQSLLQQLKAIKDVWEDYVETCGGDRSVAYKFLRKAYDLEDIEQMREWLDVGVLPIIEAASKEEDDD